MPEMIFLDHGKVLARHDHCRVPGFDGDEALKT